MLQDRNVLDAAARVLAESGPAGFTLERVAAEAGLSRVTLHRRGIGREALLRGLTERAIGDLRDALWPALTGPGTGAERLEAALVALCEVTERHLALLLGAGELRDRAFHDPGGLTQAEWAAPFERLLRDGAADGTLRAHDDPATAATVLFNLVGWTYAHLRSEHRWAARRAREAVLDLALRGVVSP
jgi:AcrR family transcriptional regulator